MMCESSGLKELELRFHSDHSRGDSFFFFFFFHMFVVEHYSSEGFPARRSQIHYAHQ